MNKHQFCNNCNQSNHDYKHCHEPITSWGIILIRNNTNLTCNSSIDLLNSGIQINNKEDINKICESMNSVKFLLVRRRHSLGYTEFMRGRYANNNIDGIIFLFQQMIPYEIEMIKTKSFDELWTYFWNNDTKKMNLNKREYNISNEKFEQLKNKIDVDLPLDFYVNNVKSLYNDPEWGFPKGRKCRNETDFQCALREFCEETGYNDLDIKIISNIKPIIENIIGTNGISYRHIYFLAELISKNEPLINEKNNSEIGAIGFYTYEETIQLFREYHIEKRNIVRNIFIYYTNSSIHDNNDQDKNILIDSEPNEWCIENDDF